MFIVRISLHVLTEKATCQDLGIIRNGGRQIPIPPKEGDSAYFFCQAGSQMIGVSKTVCTRSGMWADPWPRCGKSNLILLCFQVKTITLQFQRDVHCYHCLSMELCFMNHLGNELHLVVELYMVVFLD